MLRVAVLVLGCAALMTACALDVEEPSPEIKDAVGSDSLNVEVAEAAPGCNCHGSEADVCGTLRGETLSGDGGDDVIQGRAGSDVIYAGDGDDIVCGGGGSDVIHGGDGDDVLYGAGGGDVIYGDQGRDTLYGGPGNDYLDGGPGHDTCYRGSPQNVIVNCEIVI